VTDGAGTRAETERARSTVADTIRTCPWAEHPCQYHQINASHATSLLCTRTEGGPTCSIEPGGICNGLPRARERGTRVLSGYWLPVAVGDVLTVWHGLEVLELAAPPMLARLPGRTLAEAKRRGVHVWSSVQPFGNCPSLRSYSLYDSTRRSSAHPPLLGGAVTVLATIPDATTEKAFRGTLRRCQGASTESMDP
jgi:hypothetical protein